MPLPLIIPKVASRSFSCLCYKKIRNRCSSCFSICRLFVDSSVSQLGDNHSPERMYKIPASEKNALLASFEICFFFLVWVVFLIQYVFGNKQYLLKFKQSLIMKAAGSFADVICSQIFCFKDFKHSKISSIKHNKYIFVVLFWNVTLTNEAILWDYVVFLRWKFVV